MEINELNEAKIPLVRINKKLNRFKGKILFEKKLQGANKLLLRAKLPTELSIEKKQ